MVGANVKCIPICWIRVFVIDAFISVPLKSGQININQTIPEKGKN